MSNTVFLILVNYGALRYSAKMNSSAFLVPALVFLSSISSVWAQTPSTTYDRVAVYTDGTVQIFNPRYREPRRELRINDGSDLNGVCRHFGFGGALEETVKVFAQVGFDNCRLPTVMIDRFGTPTKRNICDLFDGNESIGSIRCAPAGWRFVIPDTYLERVQNNNGTTTLFAPWFALADADRNDPSKRLYFNDHSDRDGVCKHFGLRAYVDDTLAAHERCELSPSNKTVRVGEDGRVLRVEACADADTILAITCR